MKARILIVDDNETHADSLRESLERVGHQCAAVYGAREAFEIFQKEKFDIVVTDLMLKDGTGIDLMKQIQSNRPDTAVLIITAHGTIENAVKAMKEGAADYIEKPIQIEQLRMRIDRLFENLQLRQENIQLHRQLEKTFGFEGIVGNSPQMQRIFDVLGQVASTDATVLLLGESGTGKELVAKAIHNNSPRQKNRFVAINCAALSESLIESELFGHEKGAFTGALTSTEGRIEYASGGTLFLDEVGDMPLATQVKLLRVLEQREVVRVGSNRAIPVDVRIVAATNSDLEEKIQERTFREDLFFRLHVVTLHLPPLRERKGDIPFLMEAFVKEFAAKHQKKIKAISPEARVQLMQYYWPGNVRELRNAIENMVVVTRDEILGEDDLPSMILRFEGSKEAGKGGYTLEGKSMADVERDLIQANLKLVEGNREKCAKILGLGERTLYRKIKEYGL